MKLSEWPAPGEKMITKAEYGGVWIVFSSLGNFFVLIANLCYKKDTLLEATNLVDELKKIQRN